jgi:hypothetical protein
MVIADLFASPVFSVSSGSPEKASVKQITDKF